MSFSLAGLLRPFKTIVLVFFQQCLFCFHLLPEISWWAELLNINTIIYDFQSSKIFSFCGYLWLLYIKVKDMYFNVPLFYLSLQYIEIALYVWFDHRGIILVFPDGQANFQPYLLHSPSFFPCVMNLFL